MGKDKGFSPQQTVFRHGATIVAAALMTNHIEEETRWAHFQD
jgi:hypothetical protein